MIGTLVDEFAFAVEAGKVREFARAIQDPSDGVPLTFTAVAAHHRDARAAVEKLGLDIRRVVVGEVEWEYARPLVVGDELHGRRVVAGVRETRADDVRHARDRVPRCRAATSRCASARS